MDVLLKSVEPKENGEHTFDPSGSAEAGGEHVDEMEIKQIKERTKELEAESKKFNDLKNEFEKSLSLDAPSPGSMGLPEELVSMQGKQERDQRSVYVGNVDYGTEEEELCRLFGECGAVNKVTIRKNKRGEPVGYAYVEFNSKEAVTRALALDQTLFRDRPIKVSIKRTNIPGLRTRRAIGGHRRMMRGMEPPRRFRS